MSTSPDAGRSRYRGMDAATVEREYQPSLHVDSMQRVIDWFDERGAAGLAAEPHERSTYGDHPDEWLWWLEPPSPRAPLLVVLHGGYWRLRSADDGCLLSPAAAANGLGLASVNYSLCPSEPLSTLVDQARRAVGHVLDRHSGPVYLVGHSAGAHLGAMVASVQPRLAGWILVSGIYDLEPIRFTTINLDIRLDEAEARRLSPMSQTPVVPRAPGIVAWADADTGEFARQSVEWADRWAAGPGGAPVARIEVPGRNHFDVIGTVLDPSTVLGSAALELMRTVPEP